VQRDKANNDYHHTHRHPQHHDITITSSTVDTLADFCRILAGSEAA
jgi:hypothetical protein